jgi:Ni/Fe-hydrogenase 1 B-type cytochrome subunit
MGDTRTVVKEWSAAMRLNHWSMVLSIVILIVTGFYIATPFSILHGETTAFNIQTGAMDAKFFMGYVRGVHILFGVLLTFIFIWRLYLAFFSRFHADWKDFFAFTDLPNSIKQLKFYALVSKEPAHHKYIYGPMQSLAYGGLLVMVVLIIITGLIMMGAGYHAGLTAMVYSWLKPVENLLGGLSIVRWIHHILTWCFILFILAHVYMVFWYDVLFKEGIVSSMIGGNLFKKSGH